MTDELEIRSGLGGHFKGEAIVVRPKDSSRSAFQIDARISKNEYSLPIDAAVYSGDVIERRDPRGGIIEFVVDDVEFHPDPFSRGAEATDHLTAVVTERGRESRPFASTHIHISGNSNQVAVGSSDVTMLQSNSADAGWVAALKLILAEAPTELDIDTRAELEEAVEDATALPTSASANRKKRALDGVRGVLERIGTSTMQGASSGISTWASTGTKALIEQISRQERPEGRNVDARRHHAWW